MRSGEEKKGTARRARRGFTLLEIALVMGIIGIIYCISLPYYPGSVERAREAALKEDLRVLRQCLDDHYRLERRWPARLEDLVARRYLRRLPVDPLTGQADWEVLRDEGGGICDVRSRSTRLARDGTPYRSW